MYAAARAVEAATGVCMPIGEPCRRRRPPGPQRGASRGFTYLLLLFSLAVGGATLAALGSSWLHAAQRSREAELIFRGEQIRAALQHYHDNSPPGQARLPESLAALLTDLRDGHPRHHLRRLWPDPFTGQADWLLLREANGPGIVGVRSRAQHSALRRHAAPRLAQPAAVGADRLPAADRPPRVGDWLFTISPLPMQATPPRPPSS